VRILANTIGGFAMLACVAWPLLGCVEIERLAWEDGGPWVAPPTVGALLCLEEGPELVDMAGLPAEGDSGMGLWVIGTAAEVRRLDDDALYTSAAGPHAVVLRLDGDLQPVADGGEPVLAFPSDGAGSSEGRAVAAVRLQAGSGSLVICGAALQGADPDGGKDALVARFNDGPYASGGEAVLGGAGDQEVTGVAVDRAGGAVHVAGGMAQELWLDGTSLLLDVPGDGGERGFLWSTDAGFTPGLLRLPFGHEESRVEAVVATDHLPIVAGRRGADGVLARSSITPPFTEVPVGAVPFALAWAQGTPTGNGRLWFVGGSTFGVWDTETGDVAGAPLTDVSVAAEQVVITGWLDAGHDFAGVHASQRGTPFVASFAADAIPGADVPQWALGLAPDHPGPTPAALFVDDAAHIFVLGHSASAWGPDAPHMCGRPGPFLLRLDPRTPTAP
jgi:hypothetical protein